MSIAVSAVVHPSRLLSGLVVGMCAGLMFIAYAVVSGGVGSLSIEARVVVALICVAAVLCALLRTAMHRKIHALHVSGTGQIRLSVLEKKDRPGIDDVFMDGCGEVVRLLPASTLWSGLLLLHLQNERQQIAVVTILPDSVSRESFRALLVACRWIVMRHAEADNQRIGEI